MKLQTLIEHALDLLANYLKAKEEALELWQLSVSMEKIDVRKKCSFSFLNNKKIKKK
jgi:hypothetical protein